MAWLEHLRNGIKETLNRRGNNVLKSIEPNELEKLLKVDPGEIDFQLGQAHLTGEQMQLIHELRSRKKEE